MSGEFGNDFISLIDDDGNEVELEHLDTAEIDGEIYMAFLPADIDEDDEDFGMIILKVIVEDNEEILASIEDDEVLSAVYGHFLERLSDDEEG